MEMQKQRTCIAKGSSDSRDNNYSANSGKYGDAVYETSANGNSSSSSWYGDYSYFPTRAILSSGAEAFTMMVRVQACSISTATVGSSGSSAVRSVRSWSHFNVTLSPALCKSAENIKCHPMQITGSENEMRSFLKKSCKARLFLI